MKKLLTKPIIQSDIDDYLNNYADFSFEIRVLKEFIGLGFQCSHGGTYNDPVTGKAREFDIRALLQNESMRVHLSIECKNFKDYFPLVVHCLERKKTESYNELIHTYDPKQRYVHCIDPGHNFIERIRSCQFSLYKKDAYVAKSTDQVGRSQSEKSIVANDNDAFERISQAINSATDLICETKHLDASNIPYWTFVCPVLVIPDSMLWQVKYSDDGEQIGVPEQINHISYYIGKEWEIGHTQAIAYTISHLEIVVFTEIKSFVKKYLHDYVDMCCSIIARGAKFL